MIEKIKSIENVATIPTFFKDQLYFYNNENVLFSYSSDKFELISKNKMNRKAFLSPYNSNLKFIEDSGIYSLSNDALEIKLLWKAKKARPVFFGEKYVYERNNLWRENKIESWLYDKKSEVIIWYKVFENGEEIWHLEGSYFISDINTTFIECVNIIDLNKLWRFDFDKNEKSSGSIHRHNNILLIPSTVLDEYGFIENYHLRAIDLETGKVLWKNKANNKLHQNKKTGFLYSFWSNLMVVDPLEGVIYNEKLLGKTLPPASSCHLEYPYLYFSTRNHHELTIHLGRVNVKTKTLDFILPSDVGPETKLSSFAYHNQRFYLLDMKNVLHIYEMNE